MSDSTKRTVGGVALALLLGLGAWRACRSETTASNTAPAASTASSQTAPREVAPGNGPEVVAIAAPDDAAAPVEAGGLHFGWGNGPNALGRGTSEDGFPGGPNSFTHGDDGSTWILDQYNQRVVRVDKDGKVVETRTTSLKSPADVSVDKSGNMAIIDRTRSYEVELFDSKGRSRGTLPLPDEEPGTPSNTTRVFSNDGKVFGQQGEGGPLLLLGSADGKAAEEKTQVDGQMSRDGRALLSAGIVQLGGPRVWVTAADPATRAQLWTREANVGMELIQILLLDSDLSGMIYFVLRAELDVDYYRVVVLCMDAAQNGKITKSFALPWPEEPLDVFKRFDVAPEGGLLAAEYNGGGASYRTHSCRD